MKRTNLLMICSIIFLLLSVLMGCSSHHTINQTDGPLPIKIGVLIPKTGKGKDWGEKQEIAIKLAAQEINDTGGINGSRVEMIILDTGGKNEEAVTLTRNLIKQDVVAIAGPYFSGECEVAFPIANQAGVPIISSSSAKPGISEKNRPWAFRNSATNDRLMDIAVPVFAEHYKVNQFAILYDEKDAVSKADGTSVFPTALEKYHLDMINKHDPITFTTGNTDFSVIVTKLKGMKPEAIAFGGLYQDALSFAKEMRRQGLQIPVIGTVGILSSALLEFGGSDVEGFVAPSYFDSYSDDPDIKSFVERFKPEAAKLTPHSVLPDPFVATAYDTIQIIAKSIQSSGLNGDSPLEELRTSVQSGWEELKDYQGITGTFSMNEAGDAIKQVYVMKVENGIFKEIVE